MATPAWQHVESSAIDAIAYDPARRELFVRFSGGAEYAYRGVPPEEVAALLAAESIGTFVNTRIKPRYEVR